MARKSKESEPDDDGDNADEPEAEVSKRTQYVGLGLIASLVVGFSPLRDAFEGNGSFENAMFRFLACFVACIFAASIIGRMLDAAPESEPGETGHAAGPEGAAAGRGGQAGIGGAQVGTESGGGASGATPTGNAAAGNAATGTGGMTGDGLAGQATTGLASDAAGNASG